MDMQERALAYLDDDELVQLTRDLVCIRSINPPGDEAAVATCVAERLERTGMFADVVPHEEAGRRRRRAMGRNSGESYSPNVDQGLRRRRWRGR